MRWADKGCLVNGSSTCRFDFGIIADRYDAWYQTPRGAMYDRLEKRAIDRLLPRNFTRARLLEIGCGTGHWSEYFSNKGFEVTGIDSSEQMIAVARRRRMTKGTFDVADAATLPFADGSFDVAAAITVLEFVRDPARVVSEMVRCVKKTGGMLIVGALNQLSAYNQSRKYRAAGTYASAGLLFPADMRDLLAPFGEPTILVAGFVPRCDAFVWLSPLLEWIADLTGRKHGAFLAGKVTL